jgi:type IV secretion system protein VirD4
MKNKLNNFYQKMPILVVLIILTAGAFVGGMTIGQVHDSIFLFFASSAYILSGITFGFGVYVLSFYKGKRKFVPNFENYEEGILTARDLNYEQNQKQNKMLLTYVVQNQYEYDKEKLVKRKEEFDADKTGLLLSSFLKLSGQKTNEHVLAWGPSGTGKSSTIAIPAIFAMDNASIVVTDPKGELHKITKQNLLDKGYKVLHLNFSDPQNSDGYNILQKCIDEEEVQNLVETILSNTGDNVWANLSTDYLLAFALRQWKLGGTLSDVMDEVAFAPSEIDELEAEFFDEIDDPAAYVAFRKFKSTADGKGFVSSVKATVNSSLRVYGLETLRIVQNNEQFDPKQMRHEKTALFISYDETKAYLYQFFLSPFYRKLFGDIKKEFSIENEDGYLPVRFILDEFVSMGVIPGIDTDLATIRSRKMGVLIFVQNIVQIEERYGKLKAQTIIANCKTKMVLDSLDSESAKQVSSMFGMKEVERTSRSSGNSTSDGKSSSSNSTSTSIQVVPVIYPNEITNLASNQVYIITANLRPFIDQRNFYYKEAKVDPLFEEIVNSDKVKKEPTLLDKANDNLKEKIIPSLQKTMVEKVAPGIKKTVNEKVIPFAKEKMEQQKAKRKPKDKTIEKEIENERESL